MTWIALLIASQFPVVWALSIKQSAGFIWLWPSVVTIAAMVVAGLVRMKLSSPA